MKKNALEKLLNIKLNIDKVKDVVMDTRLLKEGDVFVAIKGGNDFIDEAIAKKVSLIICENTKYSNNDNIIVVENTIEFMQNWAKLYLEELDILKIGITGSNGKTSTKDIIYELLSLDKKGKKTLGNYNNHIGLPFTVLQLEEQDQFSILEMGMSNFGEIDLLGEIVRPEIACITNIGDSHLENLGSREGVYKAKTELIKYAKDISVVNGDDVFLKKLDAIKIGFEDGNDFQITKYKLKNNVCEFEIAYRNKSLSIETNLYGKHNALNIAMALAIVDYLGYDLDLFREKLKNLTLTKMRFEKVQKENRIYINDAYNASPVSVKYALETFKDMYKDKKRFIVLGDMLELGSESKKLHMEVASTLKPIPVDKIYLYGPEMKALYEVMKDDNRVFYMSKDEIQRDILSEKNECYILLKGSRGMKLEEIIK